MYRVDEVNRPSFLEIYTQSTDLAIAWNIRDSLDDLCPIIWKSGCVEIIFLANYVKNLTLSHPNFVNMLDFLSSVKLTGFSRYSNLPDFQIYQ